MAYSSETLPVDRRESAAALEAQLHSTLEVQDERLADQTIAQVFDGATRLEYPDLMLQARLMQLQREIMRADHKRAIGTYIDLVRLIDASGSAISQEMREGAYLFSMAPVAALLSMPDASREQIDSFIDGLDREHRKIGAPASLANLARAMWAAHRGDRDETQRWVVEWHVSVPLHGENGASTVGLDAMFISTFDLEGGANFLYNKLATVEFEGASDIELLVRLASYRTLLGDAATAAEQTRAIIDDFGLDTVLGAASVDDLILALENDLETAGQVVAAVGPHLSLEDPSMYQVVAALARFELRRDPSSARGLALADQARRMAASYDHRNGNQFQTHLLNTRWLRGIGTPNA